MAARDVPIGDGAPDLVVWMHGDPETGAAGVGGVEAALDLSEPMAAAAAPDDEPLEALRGQRLEDILDEALERRLAQVDIAAVTAVLGRGAERRRGEDEDDESARLEALGDRLAELRREPRVEVDGEMRPLLLGAAGRH
jgi:hypothetical protein